MPIVLLTKSNGLHATVLEENTVHGTGPDRFVKIKNSNKNEPTIEVKLNMTPNSNGWSLASTACLYIKIN